MITVETKGLRELAKSARKLNDQAIVNGLKDANAAAAQVVVNRARAVAGTTGRPSSVIAAGSLRVTRQAAKAAVIFGRNNVPWYMGANFGAKGNRYPQFPRAGRAEFLYRAIGQTKTQFESLFGDALEKLIDKEL